MSLRWNQKSERVFLFGECGIGKSFIINSFLRDNVIPSRAGYIVKNSGLGCLTGYPITVQNSNSISLDKYIDGHLSGTYPTKEETINALNNLDRSSDTFDMNIHFVLKYPLKEKSDKTIYTDGLFINGKDNGDKIIGRYLDFAFNHKNTIFGVDKIVYIVKMYTSVKFLSDSNIDHIKTLLEEAKEFNVPFEILINTYGALKDDATDDEHRIQLIVNAVRNQLRKKIATPIKTRVFYNREILSD